MDFFQESAQKIFIPCCLENQTTRNAAEPTPSPIDNPTESRSPNGQSQSQLLSASSPYSQESEPDVTVYAEAVVQRIERNKKMFQKLSNSQSMQVPKAPKDLKFLLMNLAVPGLENLVTPSYLVVKMTQKLI